MSLTSKELFKCQHNFTINQYNILSAFLEIRQLQNAEIYKAHFILEVPQHFCIFYFHRKIKHVVRSNVPVLY